MQQRTSNTCSVPLPDVCRSSGTLPTLPILNPIRSLSTGHILSKVRTLQNNPDGIPKILNFTSPMKNRIRERSDGQLSDNVISRLHANSKGGGSSIVNNESVRHEKKVRPETHEISKSVFHITDYTVPEAPCLGFDFLLLPLVCSALLPQGEK